MMDPRDEANLYKDLPKEKLKKIIREYKILSFANSELCYFLLTLLTFGGTFLFFFGISINSIFFMFLSHYIICWEIIYRTTSRQSSDKKEKEEIDQIIEILKEYLEDKK